ncbi:50S ribosomal protein L10 [Patescibacteria group bacterium]
MPSEKNLKLVEELKEKLSKAKSVAFIDYKGLSADQVNEFRQQIKDTEAEALVAKNTLLKIAIEESKDKALKEAVSDLQGPTMVIFSYNDPISPIKAVFDFGAKIELPRVKSAIIDGKYNDEEAVSVVKDIPSKEVLYAQIVGGLNSPISGFVMGLSGIRNKFVFAVNDLANKKTEGGAE